MCWFNFFCDTSWCNFVDYIKKSYSSPVFFLKIVLINPPLSNGYNSQFITFIYWLFITLEDLWNIFFKNCIKPICTSTLISFHFLSINAISFSETSPFKLVFSSADNFGWLFEVFKSSSVFKFWTFSWYANNLV